MSGLESSSESLANNFFGFATEKLSPKIASNSLYKWKAKSMLKFSFCLWNFFSRGESATSKFFNFEPCMYVCLGKTGWNLIHKAILIIEGTFSSCSVPLLIRSWLQLFHLFDNFSIRKSSHCVSRHLFISNNFRYSIVLADFQCSPSVVL